MSNIDHNGAVRSAHVVVITVPTCVGDSEFEERSRRSIFRDEHDLGRSMNIFVHRQNLEHYRWLLADSSWTNPVRHKMLIRLLADEEAKETKSPMEQRVQPGKDCGLLR